MFIYVILIKEIFKNFLYNFLINHLNNIFEIYWVKSNLDKYKKSNVKVYLTDMIGIIRLSTLDDEDNCKPVIFCYDLYDNGWWYYL